MSACPTCGNQWQHDADGLARCQAMHARRERVENLAAEYSDYVPWAPVKPVQTFDLWAHLRSRGCADEAAEAAVLVVLELGWRPYGPVPDETPSEAQDAGDGFGTGDLLDALEVTP